MRQPGGDRLAEIQRLIQAEGHRVANARLLGVDEAADPDADAEQPGAAPEGLRDLAYDGQHALGEVAPEARVPLAGLPDAAGQVHEDGDVAIEPNLNTDEAAEVLIDIEPYRPAAALAGSLPFLGLHHESQLEEAIDLVGNGGLVEP